MTTRFTYNYNEKHNTAYKGEATVVYNKPKYARLFYCYDHYGYDIYKLGSKYYAVPENQ